MCCKLLQSEPPIFLVLPLKVVKYPLNYLPIDPKKFFQSLRLIGDLLLILEAQNKFTGTWFFNNCSCCSFLFLLFQGAKISTKIIYQKHYWPPNSGFPILCDQYQLEIKALNFNICRSSKKDWNHGLLGNLKRKIFPIGHFHLQ